MTYKKSQERKQQILDCAKRLFARKGYQATQIADICEELHIARGTVYQYFKHKEDIFHTLIKEYFDDISVALESTGLDRDKLAKAGAPPLDVLKATLVENTHAFLRHMYGDRDIGRIMLIEAYNTQVAGISDILRDFFDARKQRAVENLRMGMAIGVLRKIDPELIASAMLGSGTRVVLDFIIEDKIKSEDDLFKIAEELVSFQLQGVLSDAERVT